MVAVACALWFGQQKGWIGKSSGQSGQGSPTTQSGPDAQRTGSQSGSQSGSPADTRPPVVLDDKPATTTSTKGTGSANPQPPKPQAKVEQRASAPTDRPKGTVTAAEIDGTGTENMTARERAERTPVGGDQLDELFKQEKTLIWVEGTGKVVRILADDTDGDKHQKFLMKNSDGHEVMVAHNIDLSPRAQVKEGDTISYRGEYIWTDRGGKVHFTHKPKYGGFRGGWIEVGGKRYE